MSSPFFSKQEVTSYTTKERMVLSFLSIFVMIFSFVFTQAQSTANYAFTTNTSGSLVSDANVNVVDMTTGTTLLVGPGNDSGVSVVNNIGFNFTLMGNIYSQFSASADGMVGLGAIAVSGTVNGGASYVTPKISALGGDLYVGANGKVHYKIVGTAPYRCLVVEFNNMAVFYSTTAANANNTYQVRLYETTNAVEYVYGTMFCGSITYDPAYVGFSVGNIINTNASVTTATNAVSYGATFATNTYVVSTSIPNLDSSADGSRRIYRFTPPTTVTGDVANLTFTAVTTNGTTVNWEDMATNESNFYVVRATDAAFTQNVVTSSVLSTTSLGTGTNYSAIQTGLSTGTTYYYKVLAAVEGGTSTGIIGNQATVNGTSYYWTGATGGAWNTFSNWNTAADGSGSVPLVWATSDTHIIDGAGTTGGGALSISVDRANFTVGQVLITSNTNLTLASNVATTRTITISGGPSNDFILENGSTLNLSNATNAVAFAFTGSGNTGIIAGTYIASGSTSNTINTTGGTGTLITVTATGNITSNLNSSTGGITGNATSLLFENGSNWTHQNSTTVNYIPTATWQANATATLNGNTTGTTLTSASTSLGNLIVNTTLSTVTLSAFTTAARTIQGNLTVNSTGTSTGRFRALTNGVLTINGNLIINAGTFEVGSTGGGIIVKGTTTVATGAILDLGRSVLQNEGNMVNNGSVLSSETTTTNSTVNFLGTTTPQTFSGTGTFTGRISSLGVSNPAGLTLSTPVLTQRVNLFTGTIIGSSNITIGNGLALGAAVQIGTAANTNSGGNFDAAPVFNLGTGTYTILYVGETTARTTGFEVPSTRSINNLILDNSNGLTIAGGTIEVLNGLTLTNGIVTSNLVNHIIHGSATTAGTLTGGSTASYISGPIVRTINDLNTASNYILYPVGKSGVYAPISIAPTTTSASKFRAEAFDTNTGTANPSIIGLSASRRWEAILSSGTFTDINVRLADANIVATNIPVQAATAAGSYSSAFGSVATFTAGTPNTIQSNNAVTSANYTGFISFANSNSCTGTPAPGNTLASVSTICLGESVDLSLQNTTIGLGVTYQWKSSSDGVTYVAITGETNPTLTITPVAVTYFVCDVTCSAGPATGTSTAVQITFANSVTATTAGTVCGPGLVTLGATPSAGATINWYSAQTGGSLLSSGVAFTTPSIAATTTYFASAVTSSAGNIALGAGGTNSSATAATFLPGGWGGAKTQYIIKATELIQAGLSAGSITNLGFEPTNSGQTYQGFYVNIGNTNLTTIPTTTFLPNAGLTLVYAGTEANDGFTPVANSVNNLTFGSGSGTSNSFAWDGTSNIVVSISWSRVPSANSSTATTMKVDNVGFVSTAYRQRNNVTPTAMLDETSVNSTSSNRPRFTINGQALCSSPRLPVIATVTTPPALALSDATKTICNGDATTAVTVTSTVADYDTYIWAPSTGVSGNSTTGWVFNPTATTSYTLTASQSTGSLCSTSVLLTVTVNPVPTAITFSPASSTVCVNNVQALTAIGGTIGSNGTTALGTDTTLTIENGLEPTAFNNRYEHYWLQMVFTQAELNAAGVQAGNINGIKFNINSIGSAAFVSDFKVNMGATSTSTLTGFIPTGLTQVYSAATYNQTIGINSIVFSTPYIWDGISNVIVDVRSTGADSANNSQTYYTATTDSKTVSAITTSTFSSSDAFVATNPTGTLSLKRLNTTFDWSSSVPTNITWSPATNLYTDASATVPYTGTNAATVYVNSATAGSQIYTVTATVPAFGCSTTTTLTVTTNANTSNSTTIAACGTYTWPVNGTVYTTSGTYTSVTGCNTETLVLTINASPVTTVTRSGDTLTTAEAGATYQWVLCDGSFTPIAGATSQSYVATAAGSYAVIVTKNGCSVTSDCFAITTLSSNSFDLTKLSYYPNPVIDTFTVTYAGTISSIQVYDISGRLVRNINASANEVTVDMSDLAASVYIVKVAADNTSGEFKVIKK